MSPPPSPAATTVRSLALWMVTFTTVGVAWYLYERSRFPEFAILLMAAPAFGFQSGIVFAALSSFWRRWRRAGPDLLAAAAIGLFCAVVPTFIALGAQSTQLGDPEMTRRIWATLALLGALTGILCHLPLTRRGRLRHARGRLG